VLRLFFTTAQNANARSRAANNLSDLCRRLTQIRPDGVRQLDAAALLADSPLPDLLSIDREVLEDYLASALDEGSLHRTILACRSRARRWLSLSTAGRNAFRDGRNLAHGAVEFRGCVTLAHSFRLSDGTTVYPVTNDAMPMFGSVSCPGATMFLTVEGLVYMTYHGVLVWVGSATSSGPRERNPMEFLVSGVRVPGNILAEMRLMLDAIVHPYAPFLFLRAYSEAHNGRGWIDNAPLPTTLALRAGVTRALFRMYSLGEVAPTEAPPTFAEIARRMPASIHRATPRNPRWSWDRIPEDVARIMAADLTLSLDEPEAR
jgi:hypothetical protein